MRSCPVAAEELIARAASVLNPVHVADRLFGDVTSALVTVAGNVYIGVCIDTGATGFCAERSAIAAMVTAGEYRIARIVAVWRDARLPDPDLFVLPPCGVCRHFILQVDPRNADTEVILSRSEAVALNELLPLHGWSALPAE